MNPIRKILVPVDFSGASKKAVTYGLSLALELKTRLVLAHIVSYDTAAYDKAKADLLALLPEDCRAQLDFEIIVKGGDVLSELVAVVEDREIDLIVMGTRGRSYLTHMLLGSVTDRMLRKVHVPILTVSHLDPEKEIHTPGPVSLRNILYATDLGDGTEEGLKYSIDIARRLDAALTVVHVVSSPDVFSGVDVEEIQNRLGQMITLFSDGSVPIVTELLDGVPYEEINRLAQKSDADLIILTMRSKKWLDRAVLGSTAEEVIRTATVPVLAVPAIATGAADLRVA
jgi:nucleotide-binding universal stress UspA family protein